MIVSPWSVLGGLAAWETIWWAHRRKARKKLYARASATARILGRPLVVVGAPDLGLTAGYGCGDVSVDIRPSTCPHHVLADVTRRLPFRDNSAVVFVSCVLEYVTDLHQAWSELRRIAGPYVYVVRVEPWTLTAYLYPGARRTLPRNIEPVCKR